MKRMTLMLVLMVALSAPVFAGNIEDPGHTRPAPSTIELVVNLLHFLF